MRNTVTLDQVRAGDVLTALDGQRMTSPTKITEIVEHREDGTLHVKVEQPPEWLTSPDRYLRVTTVGVERESPQETPQKAPKPRKPRKVTRTIAGLKWIRKENGWETEDGKFAVGEDFGYVTECERDHPVKIGRKLFWEVKAALDTPLRHQYDFSLVWAVMNDKRGYLCEAGTEHYYSMWVAFDNEHDRVIYRTETMKAAAKAVADHIETGEYWD